MSTTSIETLSATLCVLQVGTGNLTLAIYRQLDRRPVGEIELFGRVSSPDDDVFDGIAAIGRSKVDGTLVKAWVTRSQQRDYDTVAALPLIIMGAVRGVRRPTLSDDKVRSRPPLHPRDAPHPEHEAGTR